MKYVALLRGINVGGNTIIRMADLKEAVVKGGFTNVSTYIQSGNIIFDSDAPLDQVIARLEDALRRYLKYSSPIVVRTYEQLKKVVAEVPPEWTKPNDLRRYLAFVREPVTAADVMREIEPKKDVDFAKAGEGVVYLSTLLSGLTKSGFPKLASKKVYQSITIRNFNTVQKLLALMELK